MSNFTNCLNVQYRDNSRTMIATIHGESYGSLQDAELESLQMELQDLNAALESARNVIVDLSEVPIFGSAFLRILFDQLAPLKMLGIQVTLCGDQTGLLSLTAMNRWLTVKTTLEDALADVPESSGDRNHCIEQLQPALAA